MTSNAASGVVVAESLDSLPPAPAPQQHTTTPGAVGHELDQRRKENQLRLSSMRERLRAMGIDEQAAAPASQTLSHRPHIPLTETLPPPPPPRTPIKAEGNDDTPSLYNTPSTVSQDDETHDRDPEETQYSSTKDVSGTSLLKTQLRDKQQHYLSVLR